MDTLFMVKKRISSKSGKVIIEVVRKYDDSYILHKFISKYDLEEEKYYEIRELPNPSGHFGDFQAAIKEAERITGIDN